MISIVDVETETSLDDYAAHAALARPVEDLRAFARQTADRLEGRTVWMLNSTVQGGGVAEMLPKVVSMLRQLGVSTEWAVIGGDDEDFFALTKRIHNLIHGAGTPRLTDEDRALYRSVSEDCADDLAHHVDPEDVVVAHDPQPLGTGALLKDRLGMPAVWRCHIGLDDRNEATEAAWSFLQPWATTYDQAVFSLRAYVPPYLEDRSAIIHPAINPLSPKNRTLSVHQLTEVLRRARLAQTGHPTVDPDFAQPALRLQRDGSFEPATRPEDLGLLHRPIVTQISRWDRLKGFGPLLRGFARMKEQAFMNRHVDSERHRRRLTLSRLVLAGPDPDSVSDDPEGQEVFREICRRWQALPAEIQRDIAVITLPMASRHNNALMVNALQRCASIVAQNSRREGFGLTVTEGMWKRAPILGTHAAGIREQVTNGEQGRLLPKSDVPEAIAQTIHEMLRAEGKREEWARNARRRVSERYLIFTQVRRWLEVLIQTVEQQALSVDGQAAS